MLPGIIGVLQATEAIKLILGKGEPLIGRLLMYDALEATFREVRVPRDSTCPACSATADLSPERIGAVNYDESCALPAVAD